MFICQYCNREGKTRSSNTAHETFCQSNPNRKERKPSYGMKGKTAWNKGLTKEQDDRVALNSKGVKAYYSNTDKRFGAAAWSKEERSFRAKLHNFGGYRENAGRSKKFRVQDSFGKEVVLQSTYELKCAEILDRLGIEWVRPKHLKYDGKRYFADFYLPNSDIYLDPKNDFKAKQDREKIKRVQECNNVKVFILTQEQLTENYISSIV